MAEGNTMPEETSPALRADRNKTKLDVGKHP